MRRGRASFSEETKGIITKEGVVKKISSPRRVEVVLIFVMTGASGLETLIQGSVAPVLASKSARSLPGSPA